MVAAKKLLVYVGVPLVALVIVVGTALGFIFYYRAPEAIASESRQKIVIDHDGGADDAFAITMTLLSEKYLGGPNLVALTTTFGNVNLTQAIINSDRILALCDRQDIPIYSGAHGALISGIESDYYYGVDGLGDHGYLPPGPVELGKEPSAVALIELSKIYEGELTVIAIGPVTNLALAVKLDPEFFNRLAHLYVGAGHIYSDKYPEAEFNAAMDPEAYRIVADNSIANKVTFVPFSQIYTTLNISGDWRKNVLGAIQTPIMQALNGFEQVSSPQSTNWVQLDPAVTAFALDNNIIEDCKYTNNSILLCVEERGINTNDFSSAAPNGRLVYAANIDRYKKFLLDVYSSELNTCDEKKH